MINVSIRYYSPIDEMSHSREVLTATTEWVQLTDRLEFKQFWISEHGEISERFKPTEALYPYRKQHIEQLVTP
ncbi:hypothetical protein [Chryseobacterium jejuense]|uniref:Uncharacterized protein n=1 Tax=Chryseobacterium jejuense TaxID=445960 RepID=A0A2X2VRZ9_CHRJE|nr:hypothetical protein [Chryseobacterium jejuense]SDJ15115.1 hypothetical protein SAMN05421542_2819 [Chryseobacterium jejuense]SQB28053.1 Uncharacterised protein [Chryseobacterium jejuense]